MAESNVSKYLWTFSLNSKSGKTRFKLRTLSNFVLAIAVFLPLAVIFAIVWADRIAFAWIADAVTIIILVFVYRMFWNKRAIWIRCPHCEKKIGSSTPWVCGACDAKNENPDDFPFLHRCQSCGVEPPAYQCHHLKIDKEDEKKPCRKLIFLTDDESPRNYAYCLNPAFDTHEGKTDEKGYGKEKRWRDYKLSLARLDTDIEMAAQEFERIKEKKKPAAAMAPEDKVKASWEKRKAQTISAAEIYRREKKDIEEKFKDDPEMLKKALEALNEWYESGDWERIV
jgi:hypothetical protein